MSVRPDFVMLGVREPDGSFSIYASTELRHADLIAHREAPLAVMLAMDDPRKIPPTRFELEAVLASYAEGHGASYAEALLDLMRTWQPPDGRRSLIEEIAAVGTGSYADAKAAGLAEPMAPIADSDPVIAALADTLTRPRRHDQCDTEHAPGQCLVHNKRAKNCRYDDVPAEFRLIIEGRWCEPCMREAVKEANPMPMDTPVEIAAESQRRFAEDPKFQARATMIDGIVVESVQRIFGRTLSDGERDAARFAIAVSLVVAEQET